MRGRFVNIIFDFNPVPELNIIFGRVCESGPRVGGIRR